MTNGTTARPPTTCLQRLGQRNSTTPPPAFLAHEFGRLVRAKDIACAFAAYLVQRDGEWEPAEGGILTGENGSARCSKRSQGLRLVASEPPPVVDI
jgi:hypothetical protein